jgi:hypothetical protein
VVRYRGQTDTNVFFEITDPAGMPKEIDMGERFRAWIEVAEVIDEFSRH